MPLRSTRPSHSGKASPKPAGPSRVAATPGKAPRSAKRAATSASRTRATGIRLVGVTLHGTCSGPIPTLGLALLLDGNMVATAPVGADRGFTFELPSSALGGTLDVIAMPSGRGILPAPIPLPPRIVWDRWSVSPGRFEGRFRIPPGRAGEPILVQAYAEGRLMLQAFATPAPGSADDIRLYEFAGPARHLVDLGRPVILRPRLNGLELDQPLTVTAQEIGIAGCLDATDALEARGWAIDLTDPTRRIGVELRLGNRSISTTTADAQRDDLRDAGLSDGRSGFTIPFPPGLDRRHPIAVHVFLAGTETELAGSPRTLAPLPPVIGYFDAVEGPFAGGWAVNMHDPETPLSLEAVCDGEVIGAGPANLFRGDVEQSGMPTPWCGFRFRLDRPLVSLFGRDITLRVAGANTALNGSPRQINQNGNLVRFLTRSDSIPAPRLDRLMRRMSHRTRDTLISLIMPVYNTRREWLVEALNSVLLQWSQHWQLIIVDDGSTEPHVPALLDLAASHDPRIRIIRSPANRGIAAATNLGLRAATGAYVAFMDHDDTIEPDAVYKLAWAAQTTGADLIYSDEAVTTDDINSVLEVRARPAFSHDYYLSHPYFVHMVCVRTALAQQLQGWDERLAISADVDFVLRAIEQSRAIAHVPGVLYRWRTHDESAGHARMEQVSATMKDILARHLARSHLPATVSDGVRYNEYRLDWPDDGGEVLIVIPTRNRADLLRTCIDSIEKTAGPSGTANYRIVVIDHESTDRPTVAYLRQLRGRHTVMPYRGAFNYARMNNLAVQTHADNARHILFLNNDVEATETGWLQRLRSLTARPDVGAVGPLLLYGDMRIQHAGVLMSFSGAADHAMKFQDAYFGPGQTPERAARHATRQEPGQRHPGYNCNLTSTRDYSAVTAACVMIRREVFDRVHGFDETFVVGFNDTDLCLRIQQAGFKVLYDGATVLFHHESATRTESRSVAHPEDDIRLRQRWKRYFTDGDPFYSPLLASRGTDHTLRQDAGFKGQLVARVVHRVAPPPAPARPRHRKAPTRATKAPVLERAGDMVLAT